MPIPQTAGALAVAAALAVAPTLSVLPVDAFAVAPTAATCEVHTSTTGGKGNTADAASQLSPAEAQQLLVQARELVAELALAGSDTRAAALSTGIRSLGITPALASGWRQQARDLADTTLARMGTDADAANVSVALARAGFSPTPADVRHPEAGSTTDATSPRLAADTAASDRSTVPASIAAVSSASTGRSLIAGTLAAAIAALPSSGVEACGADSAGGTGAEANWTGQADQLVEQLASDSDPAARQLADAIAKARSGEATGGTNTVNNQVQRSGNQGAAEPGGSMSGGWGAGGQSSTSAGARVGGDQASRSDSTSADSASDNESTTDTSDDRDTGPQDPTRTGTGSTTAAQQWETKAQALADQLATAGDDPVAAQLAAQLADQGFTGRDVPPGSTTHRSAADDDDDDTTEPDASRDDQDPSSTEPGQDNSGTDSNSQDQGSQDQQDRQDRSSTDTPPVEEPSTSAPTDEDPAPNSDWDRLADCEASGNWSTATGNGYSGVIRTDGSSSGADHCASAVAALVSEIRKSISASLISRLVSPLAWSTKS